MENYLKLDFNERSDNNSPLLNSLPNGELFWRYPERQILEKKIADINQLSPTQVLCTNGGDEAITILMRIIKETSQLILPLPAFSQYIWGVESWQLNVQLLAAHSDLSIDVDKILLTLPQTENSVVVLTRPNNPTGELISKNNLFNIIDTAKKNNSWVFLDQAYVEFSQEDDLTNLLLSQFDNLVILRTLSKAYGLAGIRLGYLMGSKKLIQQFSQRCMPFNISQPSLQIANLALEEKNCLDMKAYCQVIISNRQTIMHFLEEIKVKVLPSEANFIMLLLPEKQAKAVKSFFAKNGILIRSFNEPALINCLRITIPYTTEKLLQLLKHTLAPELVCLDMDGVLIDTSNSYNLTIKATIRQLSGKEVRQLDIDQLKNSGGFNNDWILTQALLSKLGYEFKLQEVIDVFQVLYLGKNNDGFVLNETPIISQSFISKLIKKQNINFAIVTGRPFNEAKAGQQFVGLESLNVISLDDVKSPKPSPEGVKKLQKKFSNFSWMCGDNPDDIQAANASNSLAIGVGERNAEILYQAGADIVLKDINELESWL